MADTDTLLLQRWRGQSDAESFAQLVERHGAMVYAVCRRVLRNDADAEEVTQECFLALAQGKNTEGVHPAAWLHVFARSRALDRCRSEAARHNREEAYAAMNETVDEPTWQDLEPHIDEALAELPAEQRAAIVRHFLEGATHNTIAQESGLSRSAVTKRIVRGLETVRKRLAKKGITLGAAAFAALMGEAKAAPLPAGLHASLGKIGLTTAKPLPPTGSFASPLQQQEGVVMGTKSVVTVLAVGIAAVGVVLWVQHGPWAEKAGRGDPRETEYASVDSTESPASGDPQSGETHRALAPGEAAPPQTTGQEVPGGSTGEEGLEEGLGGESDNGVIAQLRRLAAEKKGNVDGASAEGGSAKADNRRTAPPGRYGVFGIVTLANGNPAPGAVVTTREIFPGESGLALPNLEAVADADGRYQLDRMPAGVYELQAQLEGAYGYKHLRFEPKRWAASGGGQGDWNGGVHAVQLDIRLDSAAAIAGRVTNARGSGEEGVYVVPFDLQAGGEPRLHAAAVSERNGKFVCEGLQPGAYDLCAYAERGAFGRSQGARTGETAHVVVNDFGYVEGRVYDAATDEGLEGVGVRPLPTGSDVTIFPLFRATETGEYGRYRLAVAAPNKYKLMIQAGADYAVPYAKYRYAEVAPAKTVRLDIPLYAGVMLAGRVYDAAGRPAPGAQVSWHIQYHDQPRVTQSMIAGEDGTFEIGPVQLGIGYVVAASHPTLGFSEVVRCAFSAGREPADIELRLGSKDLRGRVVDERNVGVAGAGVTLQLRGPFESLEQRTTTDGRGEFSFTGLSESRFGIEFAKEGFREDALYRISPEEIAEGVIIVLVRETPGVHAISGRVVSQEGASVHDALVRVKCEGDATIKEARSGDDGSFVVDELPAGFVAITASAEGYMENAWDGFAAPAANLELVLSSKQVVRVLVLDARTRRPIAGAEGRCTNRIGGWYWPSVLALSGGDGYLAIEAPAPEFRLRVHAPGYARVLSGALSVQADTATVALEPPAVVEGMVVDAETGEPVRGGRVTAREAPVDYGRELVNFDWAEVEDDRSFSFRLLPQGRTFELSHQRGNKIGSVVVSTGPRPQECVIYLEAPESEMSEGMHFDKW